MAAIAEFGALALVLLTAISAAFVVPWARKVLSEKRLRSSLEGRIQAKREELMRIKGYQRKLKIMAEKGKDPDRLASYLARATWKEMKLIGDLRELELKAEEKENEEVVS